MIDTPRVIVDPGVLDSILSHAHADAPMECCGLLLGTPERVVRTYRARNALRSPCRYLVEPEDHFAALRLARANGLALVGAYHSHPASPPVPSPRDFEEASEPGFVYVIASLLEGEVRGYRFEEGNFRTVALVPSNDH